MKATYENFIALNPVYSSWEGNNTAKEIFNLLSEDENIINMLESVNQQKPALAACVNQLETYYDSLKFSYIDLQNNFVRQGIGRMVKVILEPFGYSPLKQKDLPKALGAKYFKSASTYTMNKIPILKVKKDIISA